MSASYFIDTNIFICQLEGLDEIKVAAARRLIHNGVETKDACISFQVVQECLNTALRKSEIPLSVDEMRTYMDNVLEPLFRVPASIPLYKRALGVQARYGYSFYDSLIVAAALDAGCNRLYSEDMQDGQRIEGLTIENPFKRT